MDNIAETTFTFMKSSGEKTDVTITIGAPYKNDDSIWSCSAQMDGLYPPLHHIMSDDSFHSLCLGISFIHKLCNSFINNGGRILFQGTDGDVPLDEAYFSIPNSKKTFANQSIEPIVTTPVD